MGFSCLTGRVMLGHQPLPTPCRVRGGTQSATPCLGLVLEGSGARQAGALSTTVAEGFTEEPFLQMRYLDPVPINDWGNEELGLLGIRQGNPTPSSKVAEVRAQKVLPGTKNGSPGQERMDTKFIWGPRTR